MSALPADLRSFWYRLLGMHASFRRTRWGAVVADPRFPDVWDANHAAILEDVVDLDLDEVRAELHPALRRAGARFEHVEVWNPDRATPALTSLRAGEGRRPPDVEMLFESGRDLAADGAVVVKEIVEPDGDFLDWYRMTRNLFGEILSESVLDQLLRRDLALFVPAGLSWFVGHVHGHRAGYTTLLSLDGMGYLDGVLTLSEFRRRGVASATVAAALDAALARGNRLVHLLAEEGGEAQRLYERLGFRTVSRVESFTRRLSPP